MTDTTRHGPGRVADRAMFAMWREHGAPAGFAPDPRTGHETGDSRYLAIPFFDTCLAMRLPEQVGQPLKPVNMEPAWLAAIPGDDAVPATKFTGEAKTAAWLPNEKFARLWRQYIKTGATEDDTPPPSPMTLKAATGPEGVTLTWDAEVDFESGLQAFIIERDRKDLAQHPEKPINKFGRPLFQKMSYGDTPVEPLPDFTFTDKTAKSGEPHEYRIIAVNSAGLRSVASKPAIVK